MISFYKIAEKEELQNLNNFIFGPFKNSPSYGRGLIGSVFHNERKIDQFVFCDQQQFFSEKKIVHAKISNNFLHIKSNLPKEEIKIFVSYEYL